MIRELYFINDAEGMSTPPTVRFDDVVISDSAQLSTSDGSSTYSHSFESVPTLTSWVHPDVVVVNQDKTPSVSVGSHATLGSGSLEVTGNAWKTLSVGGSPISANDDTFLRVDIKLTAVGELQGVGVQDTAGKTLIFSIEESLVMNERWIQPYNGGHQGTGGFVTLDIPIGRRWKSVHGSSLAISNIVFVNNDDFPGSTGTILFDDLRIYDKTETLPGMTGPTISDALYFYHNDHLGTPLALTDDVQDIVWSTKRDPWGNRSDESTSLAHRRTRPGTRSEALSGCRSGGQFAQHAGDRRRGRR